MKHLWLEEAELTVSLFANAILKGEATFVEVPDYLVDEVRERVTALQPKEPYRKQAVPGMFL